MERKYNKEQILDMLRPLADCIYDDNHILRKEIFDSLMLVSDDLGYEEIYELLIAEIGNDCTAKEFFSSNLQNDHIIELLVQTALNSESGDARMSAAHWISNFTVELLKKYEKELLILQKDEWDSVSCHILVALGKIKSKDGLKYLIEKRIKPKLFWEAEALKYYLTVTY
ncbi:MAG TPA: hypothetical protein VF941_11070 [Clostridia bacterium]